MKVTQIGIQIACIVLLVAFVISCNALALGGDKKYKVELTNLLMKLQDEIDTEGEVTDKLMKKFEDFMEKSEELYGAKGSYVRAERALQNLKKARAGGPNAFMDFQNAKEEMRECKETLKTEVKD